MSQRPLCNGASPSASTGNTASPSVSTSNRASPSASSPPPPPPAPAPAPAPAPQRRIVTLLLRSGGVAINVRAYGTMQLRRIADGVRGRIPIPSSGMYITIDGDHNRANLTDTPDMVSWSDRPQGRASQTRILTTMIALIGRWRYYRGPRGGPPGRSTVVGQARETNGILRPSLWERASALLCVHQYCAWTKPRISGGRIRLRLSVSEQQAKIVGREQVRYKSGHIRSFYTRQPQFVL